MIRYSRSKTKNENIEDWSKKYASANNLRFFQDAIKALDKKNVGNGGLMMVGLLGQRDLPGHALRTAQSVLRWDLRPSLWSHAFLIAKKVSPRSKTLKAMPIYEVTLHSRSGEFPRPERNGVATGRLDQYDDIKVDANVALLAVQMTDKEAKQVKDRAENANVDRIRYNLWQTLGIWQGYLWSYGGRPNPLREGVPIFSASYVEMAFEAIGLDLTPGASEQNSAPEHLWNAALWWHEAFADQERLIHGCYVLRDKGCSLLSWDD